MRRIAAAVAVAMGITLIGFTFAEHLVTRSHDAQKIADYYKPLMSADGLADLSRGFDAVQAAGRQLDTQAEPQLATAFGMSESQWKAYLKRELPGIAHFDAQAPGVVALVGPVVGQMRGARRDYARASDIPTSWLPLSSAPWLFLGIGTLLMAVSVFALRTPTRFASAALLVVGLGIVVAPLVIGIPGKVDAAVRVTELGRVGLARATGEKAVGATELFDGMVRDVTTNLEPAFARELPGTDFATTFPTLARFAAEWQRSTSAKSHALSTSQVALASTFANADRIPLRPIPWLFIVPGLLLALLATLTLLPSVGVPAMQDSRVPAPRRARGEVHRQGRDRDGWWFRHRPGHRAPARIRRRIRDGRRYRT